MHGRWRGGLVVLAVGMLGLGVALPAAAQDDDTGWTIETFDAGLRVAADGSVEVTEQIAVDFAELERHGIFRVIPVRYAIAEGDPGIELPEGREPDEYRRVLEVEGLEVTSTAPADVETSRDGDDLVIRVGDEDETVTGRQTYELRYVVRGALNAAGDGAELDWNVTGNGWGVPIGAATARVEAPGVDEAACTRGPRGATTPCEQAQVGDDRATFATGALAPGEGLTVAVALPPGSVTAPPPIVQERWTLPRALAGSPLALPLAALTAMAGLGGVALLARRGRDETDPSAPRGDPAGPRFDPPEGLRPAQLAVLLDERVDAADLSATLVDLAARGLIEIEHVPAGDGRRTPDWRLRRATGGNDADLLDYERDLYGALFEDTDVVTVSELKGEFSPSYEHFRTMVYDDAVERGWFPRSPAATRARWLGIALAALLVAGALFGVALAFSTVAVAAIPLLVAAVALLVVHRSMPRRTASGRRLLHEARSFRDFLTSTAPPQSAAPADPAAAFTRDLPYAIAFGAAPALVSRFTALGVPPQRWAPTWYHHPYGHGAWYADPSEVSADLSALAAGVGGDLSTAPASSSSSGGTSGGGFGGGGGGSW